MYLIIEIGSTRMFLEALLVYICSICQESELYYRTTSVITMALCNIKYWTYRFSIVVGVWKGTFPEEPREKSLVAFSKRRISADCGRQKRHPWFVTSPDTRHKSRPRLLKGLLAHRILDSSGSSHLTTNHKQQIFSFMFPFRNTLQTPLFILFIHLS